MKNKKATIFLIIGCSFWLLTDIYWLIKRLTMYSESIYENNMIDLLLIPSLNILIPISFLIYAISLFNKKSVKNAPPSVETEALLEYNNMSIGDWLVTFLITIIPLGGLVAMIMWANDDTNKIKKNWAIATLIYQGILLILFLFLYIIILSSVRNSYYRF